MINLKTFQEAAVNQIKNEIVNLWSVDKENLPIVFKSPTGSGKTIMMAQLMSDLVNDPRFSNQNIAFVWLTFSEESYEQSKSKIFNYFGGAADLDLLDLNDLSRKKLQKNNVFFINWQKIKGKSKDSRKLRRESENGVTFDDFFADSHAERLSIIAIIDEEHMGADTQLALEVIEGVIKPKINLRVSATPKSIPRRDEIGGYVEVSHQDVIAAGLIKEKIVFQTEDDLATFAGQEIDQDEILLELAFNKREELVNLYSKANLKINPLVLIQLPNDDVTSRETTDISKQQIVLDFLERKGVSDSEIAIWLSQEKVNLEFVENNESEISFLIFKQAAATGWDCPRASILLMFREIKNPAFAIQTVGRILRMPGGNHLKFKELNSGYLYTNYTKSEILVEYSKNTNENLPAIHGSIRKDSVTPFILESTYLSRADYNDLGDSFQNCFAEIAEKELQLTSIEIIENFTELIVVNAEIDEFDKFRQELGKEGSEYEEEISKHDLERIYNLLCFKTLADVTDANLKFAPERSWGKLKTALNIYLRKKLDLDRNQLYKIIVNDLLKENGALRPVIFKALEAYRPIREDEINLRSNSVKQIIELVIPPKELYFTSLYEEKLVKKSSHEPFWLEKDYLGRKNELSFLEFLDSNSKVDWWFKNRDYGSDYFAITYFDPEDNRERLFYPDWIVQSESGIYILETKSGNTAESVKTKAKAEALQKWLDGKKGFTGGVVVRDSKKSWMINKNERYEYEPGLPGWELLEF